MYSRRLRGGKWVGGVAEWTRAPRGSRACSNVVAVVRLFGRGERGGCRTWRALPPAARLLTRAPQPHPPFPLPVLTRSDPAPGSPPLPVWVPGGATVTLSPGYRSFHALTLAPQLEKVRARRASLGGFAAPGAATCRRARGRRSEGQAAQYKGDRTDARPTHTGAAWPLCLAQGSATLRRWFRLGCWSRTPSRRQPKWYYSGLRGYSCTALAFLRTASYRVRTLCTRARAVAPH
eukprot:scaffold1900_cov389-Prasinococcus_capsulatus_cf.AAC.13